MLYQQEGPLLGTEAHVAEFQWGSQQKLHVVHDAPLTTIENIVFATGNI